MFRSKKSFIIFNMVSFLVLGLVFLLLNVYLQFSNTQPLHLVCANCAEDGFCQIEHSSKEGDYFASEEEDFTEIAYIVPNNADETDFSQYELNISVSKYWEENKLNHIIGAQYDVVIRNDSRHDMMDWQVQLILPEGGRLDSSWNGNFTYEDSLLTVTPMEHNAVIEPTEEITFGFVLLEHKYIYHIEECSIVFYREYLIWKHPMFWIIITAILVLLILDTAFVITTIKIRQYNRRRIEDLKIIDQSLSTFANIIDAKDVYTKGHSQRVAVYSKEIARRMGLSEDAQMQIYHIALLHDIGKIGISDAILQKPQSLTEEERVIIEQHVVIGGEVLKDFTSIPGIAEGAMYHHERYDGKGYAKGLSGEQIPLCARIICVADAFDVMSSARCYRKELEISAIIKELKENAGTQFDPDIVPFMLEMIKDGVAPAKS